MILLLVALTAIVAGRDGLLRYKDWKQRIAYRRAIAAWMKSISELTSSINAMGKATVELTISMNTAFAQGLAKGITDGPSTR